MVSMRKGLCVYGIKSVLDIMVHTECEGYLDEEVCKEEDDTHEYGENPGQLKRVLFAIFQ